MLSKTWQNLCPLSASVVVQKWGESHWLQYKVILSNIMTKKELSGCKEHLRLIQSFLPKIKKIFKKSHVLTITISKNHTITNSTWGKGWLQVKCGQKVWSAINPYQPRDKPINPEHATQSLSALLHRDVTQVTVSHWVIRTTESSD